MTNKQKFINALELKPPVSGLVPHFELVFYLTMEAFRKVHPEHRKYNQWHQMSSIERELHLQDMADIYIATAVKYDHCAIFVHPNPSYFEDVQRLLEIIREKTGDQYFIMMHGDATMSIPNGNEMMDIAFRLADEPEVVKAENDRQVKKALNWAENMKKHGLLDGFALCADYCFNNGPFLSPSKFSEFVTPYLAELVKGYRDMGYYAIKHTDGNIMPILDQLVQTNPHALHSLDPQGSVDIAKVKKLYGSKICLIGNVNCALMQTGTDDEVIQSARYALENGMPGGGYVFSTSNCIYSGMPIDRYELILKVWKEEGIYK